MCGNSKNSFGTAVVKVTECKGFVFQSLGCLRVLRGKKTVVTFQSKGH